MSDQREHGVGGLEWRDLPARTPDEPLVPLTGAIGEPGDETTVLPAGNGRWSGATGDERVGDPMKGPGPRGAAYDGDHDRVAGVLFTDDTDDDHIGDGRGDPDGPVDLSALRADDELLTALCSFDNSMSSADQDPELKSLLLSWRLDVDAEPIVELVDTDTAMAAIEVGTRIRKRKPRYLVPLASAAAVLVIVFAGMGLAARNAQPGDTLWGLSQMLYTDHARSVEAAASIRDDLHHASELMQQGHFAEARTILVQAQQALPAVDNADGKINLQQQQRTLLDQLDNSTGIATPPATTGYGLTSESSAPAQVPPVSSSTTDQATPPTTTTTPPAVTTDPTTTTTPDPPTTTTTDSVVPQSDTVGDNPALPANPPVVTTSAGGNPAVAASTTGG